MLAIIDASGGAGATVTGNVALLSINTLRAVRAVATAAAGSVPAANVVIQANTTYPIAYSVPGSNNVGVFGLVGTAAAVGTANVFQFSNGSGLVTNSAINAANNSTALSVAGAITNVTINAASVSVNVVTGNTTGGLILNTSGTPTAQAMANGVLLYITGTPSGTGAITGFVNGYYMVQNVVAGNTTFQLAYTNGTPVTTSGGGNAIGGLTFQYGLLTVSAGSGIANGQAITGTVPPTAIVAGISGTGTTGTYMVAWPFPYTTASVTANTTASFTTSQSQSGVLPYGATMYGTNNTIISATGTIGTVTNTGNAIFPGPYTATITGMAATSGFWVGGAIAATAGTGTIGTGVVTVTAINSTTSISVSSTASMTTGTITSVIASGLSAANTAGLLVYPTPHNLVVGQALVTSNTVNLAGYYAGTSGSLLYVAQVINATSFQVSTSFNGAGATTVAVPANTSVWLQPLPGPLNMTQYGTNNMITVVANTEAGGWALDSNNTTTDFFSVNANGIVTTTSTGGLILDLYNANSVNKPTYPYHKISVIPQPTTNLSSATANCYAVYHGAAAFTGFANTNSGTTLSFNGNTTALGTVANTTTQPTGPSSLVNLRSSVTGSTPANWQLSDYQFTMACNNQYMHLISNNFLISMGLRVTQAWEDNYSDNPAVFNYSIDTRAQGTSVYYPSGIFAYMRYLSNTGTFGAATRYNTFYGGIVAAANTNPVTGQAMTTVANTPSTLDIGFLRNQAPMGGIFQVDTHYLTTTYPIGYGPVYDSTTGTLVPPAYPIVIQIARTGQYNSGGNARGIYKSLSNANNSTTAMTLGSYYVSNATYTVDGDPYFPVLNGQYQSDMFLLRRA
jgi:hypothetical protein